MYPEVIRTALALFVVLTLCVACKQSSSPPPTLSVEQLPSALEKAFSKAPPQTKEMATQVINLVQSQDYGKAYVAAQNLTTKAQLNKEQSRIAASTLLALNRALESAQTKGDTKAAEVLQNYRRQK